MFVSMRKLTLIGCLTLLANCSGGGAGSYCLASAPILVSREDVLTAETARALLAHNETWATLCNGGRAAGRR